MYLSTRQGSIILNAFYLLISAVVLLPACNHKPASEKYGFITMLGNDTISVEAVSRTGNVVTTDAVDRFPRLRVRHTVIDLDTNGSIRHLEMDIHTPSEPPAQQDRHVIANVTGSKVHMTKKDGSGTVVRDFASDSAIIVAHVPQSYALYELYFVAALKNKQALHLVSGTPVKMRQFYIDREFDRFPLGDVTVTPLDNNKLEITHDWLSGTGEASMDSSFHLLSYNGDRTTYKVKVQRLVVPPDVKSFAGRFEKLEINNGPVKQLSVRDSTKAQIGNAILSIDYGRPLLRGRTLLGDVIPYDRVWRTGANAATNFTTTQPITLAGMQVPAGKYTLWTVPHSDGVDLIVNRQNGQWGTEYNSTMNLGIVRMNSETVTKPVEEFTISILPGTDANHGILIMEWGTFKWKAAIEVK